MFTKTSCYHYFHSHCLGRYITHSEMELQDRERELEEDKTRDQTEKEVGLFVIADTYYLLILCTLIEFLYCFVLEQNDAYLPL